MTFSVRARNVVVARCAMASVGAVGRRAKVKSSSVLIAGTAPH
jgi:hypothetical protein